MRKEDFEAAHEDDFFTDKRKQCYRYVLEIIMSMVMIVTCD